MEVVAELAWLTVKVGKSPFALCAAGALLLLTGCWLGDKFFTARIVTVNFSAPTGQKSVTLSVEDTQVQDALRVIDMVLTSQGFHENTNAPAANEPNPVVSYTRYIGTDLRPLDGPAVWFRTNRLEVVIMERGNRSGHLTADGKRICKSLQTELRKRYGVGKVKIER